MIFTRPHKPPPPTYAKDPVALKHYGHMETDIIHNSLIFKFSAYTLQKRRLHGLESGYLATSSPWNPDKMPPTCLFVWSLERGNHTPRMASKDCAVGEKRRPTCPLWFKGPAKWTPTWAYVCTKTPLHEKVLHASKCPPQTPAPESRMPRAPPLFLAKFAAKKAKRAPRAPLKSRAEKGKGYSIHICDLNQRSPFGSFQDVVPHSHDITCNVCHWEGLVPDCSRVSGCAACTFIVPGQSTVGYRQHVWRSCEALVWQRHESRVCGVLTHPNVSHYTYALENRDQKSPRGPQKIQTNNYNYSTSKQTNNYNYSPSKQKYKQTITPQISALFCGN